MFSQIALAEKDCPFHHILWRGLDTSTPINTYEAAQLTFGNRASPYLAQYVICMYAENNREDFP